MILNLGLGLVDYRANWKWAYSFLILKLQNSIQAHTDTSGPIWKEAATRRGSANQVLYNCQVATGRAHYHSSLWYVFKQCGFRRGGMLDYDIQSV